MMVDPAFAFNLMLYLSYIGLSKGGNRMGLVLLGWMLIVHIKLRVCI